MNNDLYIYIFILIHTIMSLLVSIISPIFDLFIIFNLIMATIIIINLIRFILSFLNIKGNKYKVEFMFKTKLSKLNLDNEYNFKLYLPMYNKLSYGFFERVDMYKKANNISIILIDNYLIYSIRFDRYKAIRYDIIELNEGI